MVDAVDASAVAGSVGVDAVGGGAPCAAGLFEPLLVTISCFKISWFLGVICSPEAGSWKEVGEDCAGLPSEMELVRLASFLLAASTLFTFSSCCCCCSRASCFTRILVANSSRDMFDVADDTDKLFRLQRKYLLI